MNDGSFIKAFKKINRIRFFAIVICILVAFASSCSLKRDLRRSKKPADVNAAVDDTRKESDIVEEAKDEPKEETKDADADESKSDSVKVEFIFTNACKEDIGMISILDPVSSEQINLGELPDGKLMKVNLDWPKDKTDFDMAVYNRNGDLVSETKVDITGVTEQVTLLLSGDHNIENVEAKIK
ncbi:MAG: hypothetical protein J6Z02_07005 [Lachnospiraceae bacterium]|nr:hypothetical protein [Lachnospiraceae bacterium]